MSTFIKTVKFGSDTKIIRVDNLSAEIGEDIYGILTDKSPENPFFYFCSLGRKILITSNNDISYRGKTIIPNSKIIIEDKDQIKINDYIFTFFQLSPCYAALAKSNCKIENLNSYSKDANLPWVNYNLAFMHYKFILLPNVEIKIGSSNHCGIHFNYSSVEKEHVSITNTPKGILIKPYDGCVMVNDDVITCPTTINSESTILLAPSTFELQIHFD